MNGGAYALLFLVLCFLTECLPSSGFLFSVTLYPFVDILDGYEVYYLQKRETLMSLDLQDLNTYDNNAAAALAAYALSDVQVDMLEAFKQNGFAFAGISQAFDGLGEIFNVKRNTIKNYCDSFDPHTSSHRRGWHKRETFNPRFLEEIFKYAKTLTPQDLIGRVIELSKKSWSAGFDNDVKTISFLEAFSRNDSIQDSNFPIKSIGPSIDLSIRNSGQRPPAKWFTVTARQIIQSIQDMIDHNKEFIDTGSGYDEKPWRDIIKRRFTSEEARDLAGTQTKPFFALLSRLIQYANDMSPMNEEVMPLDLQQLTNTIALLEKELAPIEGAPSSCVAPPEASADLPRNVLYFGAPGTGKSHNAEHYVDCQAEHFYRTVFFADYQNADFVGTIKPAMKGEDVCYRFEAGPLVNALKDAFSNPKTNVVLLIEEINRGNAPAIFGEMFQLLDRDKDGSSKYSIVVSESLQEYLGTPSDGPYLDPVRFPSNLFIIGTMNAGDQGVFVLDTAFKRRWHFKYIRIDFDAHLAMGGFSDLKIQLAGKNFSWAVFAKTVNEVLTDEVQVSEDRLLGPFFLSPTELDADDLTEAVAGKVLPYLWEDVLRYDDRTLLFDSNINSFAQLQNGLLSGKQVFSDKFNNRLSNMVSLSDPMRNTTDAQNDVVHVNEETQLSEDVDEAKK